MKVVFRTVLALAGLAFAVACGGGGKSASVEKTKEELIREVSAFEDSLKTHNVDPSSIEIATIYAEKCLLIYQKFPKSKEAPLYLDRAHMIFSSVGQHRTAVSYADTLIQKYPHYPNRPMVLQSIASAYDLFILPRRKDMVQKYYSILLKENKDLPAEERATIEKRLKYIDLTFEELISVQSEGDTVTH